MQGVMSMDLSKGQLRCLFNSAWTFHCPACGEEQKDACNKVEECLLLEWIIEKMGDK